MYIYIYMYSNLSQTEGIRNAPGLASLERTRLVVRTLLKLLS
jgi:hypothetical protein